MRLHRRTGVARLAAVALLPAAQLAGALHVAQHHWHGPPPCGQPTVVAEPLNPAGALGEVEFGACRIVLQREIDWREWPQGLCEVVVHEWGHLVLGPTYFEESNPAEPEHSADQNNIMYSTLPNRFAPCERHGYAAGASTRTRVARAGRSARRWPS